MNNWWYFFVGLWTGIWVGPVIAFFVWRYIRIWRCKRQEGYYDYDDHS